MYFIHLQVLEEPAYFEEVDGEAITIEGFEKLHFFIHRPHGHEEDMWMVSEATTGMAITGWGSRETIGETAQEKLASAGLARVKEIMEGQIKKTGRSPWVEK